MSLIPPQYRILAAGIAIAVLCALSAWGGSAVGEWRATAACGTEKDALQVRIDGLQADVAKLTGEKHVLELGVAKANEALAVAKAQEQAAEAARAQAQRWAADLKASSDSRITKMQEAVRRASGCGDVLDTYWELRR